MVSKSLSVIQELQCLAQLAFAVACPSMLTQSNSLPVLPHCSTFAHSLLAIHGSTTNIEPRFTPRTGRVPGSQRRDGAPEDEDDEVVLAESRLSNREFPSWLVMLRVDGNQACAVATSAVRKMSVLMMKDGLLQ
jgi:hypothetical protein